MSNKTRQLQSIDQRRMRGGISTKSVLGARRPKKQFSTISDIYLLIFFPNIKFIYSAWYWQKSLQCGQSAQFDGGLDVHIWVRMKLVQNSVMPQLGGGGGVLRSQKRKIYPFLSQLMRNQKLYNISKNQPPKSIGRRDGDFPPPSPL